MRGQKTVGPRLRQDNYVVSEAVPELEALAPPPCAVDTDGKWVRVMGTRILGRGPWGSPHDYL